MRLFEKQQKKSASGKGSKSRRRKSPGRIYSWLQRFSTGKHLPGLALMAHGSPHHSEVFQRFVHHPEDVTGMIAYCACLNEVQDHFDRNPHLTEMEKATFFQAAGQHAPIYWSKATKLLDTYKRKSWFIAIWADYAAHILFSATTSAVVIIKIIMSR